MKGRFLSSKSAHALASRGRWPRIGVVSTVWPTPKSGQGKELYLLLDAVLPTGGETKCVFFSADQDEVMRRAAAKLPLETFPVTSKIVVQPYIGRIANRIPRFAMASRMGLVGRS